MLLELLAQRTMCRQERKSHAIWAKFDLLCLRDDSVVEECLGFPDLQQKGISSAFAGQAQRRVSARQVRVRRRRQSAGFGET